MNNPPSLKTSSPKSDDPSTARRGISWGDVEVRTPERTKDSDTSDIKWRDHRRHLGSFEDERALKALSGEPRTKIQLLKDMRKMRRAALRGIMPPARKILRDPRGNWVLLLFLMLVTLTCVHFYCDTWIEALILLTFVTVATAATATVQ